MTDLNHHPVSRIKWVDVNALYANSYNPNVVLQPELKLLKLSILSQGWIQPILVAHTPGDPRQEYEIIDGFHRFSLAKTDPQVNQLSGGLVPVVIMDLSVPERMLLTVRINRAKGNHVAVRMHELVSALYSDWSMSVADIASGIGASLHEVNTLLAENIFVRKDVANVSYSKSWIPKLAR